MSSKQLGKCGLFASNRVKKEYDEIVAGKFVIFSY